MLQYLKRFSLFLALTYLGFIAAAVKTLVNFGFGPGESILFQLERLTGLTNDPIPFFALGFLGLAIIIATTLATIWCAVDDIVRAHRNQHFTKLPSWT
ncbi:MAG TPA: hypothetical protein VMU25_01645 [Candidatus Paceibacterota bacterium]|nr:hypothetical protein [Candidatus Paceibacterota bacterium]